MLDSKLPPLIIRSDLIGFCCRFSGVRDGRCCRLGVQWPAFGSAGAQPACSHCSSGSAQLHPWPHLHAAHPAAAAVPCMPACRPPPRCLLTPSTPCCCRWRPAHTHPRCGCRRPCCSFLQHSFLCAPPPLQFMVPYPSTPTGWKWAVRISPTT